ncbi:BON domain-containing protein [Hymenobacter antarcticus]|uniref:BON domain-containing protein n=1 Tax=Hymenobacter antarcticus TaxID=486270 RepID=A0ABP7R319_9BACT
MPTAQLLPPPAPPPPERVADADITAAIEMLLATKKGLIAHLIAVHTREGIVVLTGSTDNLLARQRAEEITLAVRPADVPDAELQHAGARALFVAYWALGHEIRREKFAPKTDAAIGAAVRAPLQRFRYPFPDSGALIFSPLFSLL